MNLNDLVKQNYEQMAREQIERGLVFFTQMPGPTPMQLAERARRTQEHLDRAVPFLLELKDLCEKHGVILEAVGDEMDQEIEIIDAVSREELARTGSTDYPGPWRAI